MSVTAPTIARTALLKAERTDRVDMLFGLAFPLQLEPFVFQMASVLSPDYQGGCWDFYVLNNDGFYMAPENDVSFRVQCPNGFEGVLSADALGITVCLYAYSHLSFTAAKPASTIYANMYHRLREYVMDHEEVESILQATD